MKLEKLPPPSPAPLTIEQDPEFSAFERKLGKVEARKARMVPHQIGLESSHAKGGSYFGGPTPIFSARELKEKAAALLASPPGPDEPLPETLAEVLAERALLDQALSLAQIEGHRLGSAAMVRVRQARAEEWRAAVRRLILAVLETHRAQIARDRLFSQIGFGPSGRWPLEYSDYEILMNHNRPLKMLLEAAVRDGLLDRREIDA